MTGFISSQRYNWPKTNEQQPVGVLAGRVLLGSWRLSSHIQLLHELGNHHINTAGDITKLLSSWSNAHVFFPPVSNVYNKVGLENWRGGAWRHRTAWNNILEDCDFNSILWPGIGHKYDKINNSNSCSFLISDTRGSRQNLLRCEGFLTRISLQTHTFESMLRPSEWNCISVKPRICFHLIQEQCPDCPGIGMQWGRQQEDNLLQHSGAANKLAGPEC